jgi:MFS family permease
MTTGPKGLGPPKMPVRQMVILSIARFSEPIALTSVLPYLPEMIQSFGVPRNDVGRWAGVCMAVFSISQSFCGIPWGALSDSVGRKPTIVFGLFATMLSFVLWGLSRDLRMAIAVRIFAGVSNGNVGIIRTMVAEMVPWKELQPKAFSVMPMIWGIGSVLGPMMGGFFANPARRWPGVFGGVVFWQTYPYALPSFIAAAVFLTSLASAIFFLEETLESKKHRRDWGVELGHRFLRAFGRSSKASPSTTHHIDDNESAEPLITSPTTTTTTKKPTPTKAATHTVRDVLTRHTVCFLLAYFALGMHTVAFEQVLSVFLSHPWRDHTPENTHLPFQFGGGFGLSTEQIGTLFTLYGFSSLTQFFVFPPLARKVGVLNCFRFCSLIHPLYMFIMPYMVLLPNPTLRWSAVLFTMCTKAASSVIAFPSLTVLITNSASSPAVLGTVNGAAVTVAGFGRALGPAITGAIFSWGVANNYVIAPWWYLAVVAALGAVPAFLVDEPDYLSPKTTTTTPENENENEDGEETRCATAENSDGDDDDDNGETRCEERGLLRGQQQQTKGYGTTV